MRCPECGNNHQRKAGMRCQCGYHFALRKWVDGLGDPSITKIIKQLGGVEQHCFTRNQLVFAIYRFLTRKAFGPIAWSLGTIILFFSVGFLFEVGVQGYILLMAGALLVGIIQGKRHRRQISLAQSEKIIDKYHALHPIVQLASGNAYARSPDPEFATLIAAFSPEQILIVERDELVDMLIRNHFHLDHKTAVLSISGYPDNVFQAVSSWLEKQPHIPVQVIHDASHDTFNLVAQLQNRPQWAALKNFQPSDLGMRRSIILQNTGELPWLCADRKFGCYSRKHRKMLKEGCVVRVDSAPPTRLLSALAHALVSHRLVASSLYPAAKYSSTFSAEYESEGDDFG